MHAQLPRKGTDLAFEIMLLAERRAGAYHGRMLPSRCQKVPVVSMFSCSSMICTTCTARLRQVHDLKTTTAKALPKQFRACTAQRASVAVLAFTAWVPACVGV